MDLKLFLMRSREVKNVVHLPLVLKKGWGVGIYWRGGGVMRVNAVGNSPSEAVFCINYKTLTSVTFQVAVSVCGSYRSRSFLGKPGQKKILELRL